MPAHDSPAVLVARFLRSNGYNDTLVAFLSEAGLPPDTGIGSSNDTLTIEQLLLEKKLFDLNQAFEKTNVEDVTNNAWTVPAPSKPTIIETLPSSSNVLHVALETVFDDERNDEEDKRLIMASGADRTINLISPRPPYKLHESRLPVSDSPVLSWAFLPSNLCVTSCMSGRVALHNLSSASVIDERRDHFKYVVKVISSVNETGQWVATAGWDARILVYWLGPYFGPQTPPPASLRSPVAETKLASNPEAILFVSHPEISTPVLVLTRRDSTFLYYYAIPNMARSDAGFPPLPLNYLGRQNLAPHSNSWIAFTPSALAISPHDPALLAVATSTVPHMKLIILRLLLPPPKLNGSDAQSAAATQPLHATQASQAQADLALQTREDSAILIHCTTLAPQTPYSTPALVWRPDGSGIFVNGDDGAVRGIETSTGKVIATLVNGHETGTKIRCLWAGWADKDMREEVVVSGGFDRRLVVWRVA